MGCSTDYSLEDKTFKLCELTCPSFLVQVHIKLDLISWKFFFLRGHFYRPQTKLRKGNVFTNVCQEFCPQGGCTPPGQTPPPPSDGHCSGRYASNTKSFANRSQGSLQFLGAGSRLFPTHVRNHQWILHSGILLNNILKFPFSNGFKESPCEHVEPLQAPRVHLQLLHKVANVGKETVCKTETFSIFT